MKLLLFLLALWAVLGLVQCKKDTSIEPNQEFSSAKGQTVRVAAEGSEVDLSVTDISDSRCPSDVVCVWAGQANVKVEMSGGSGAKQNVALCLGACANDSAAVAVNTVPYWLILKAVSPYPALKQNLPVPQKATLLLARR